MNTITDYEQQAAEFMAVTNSKIDVKYLRTGKHFDSDSTERDIYKITLTSKGRTYKFNFGQSLIKSGSKPRVKPTAYDVLCCLTKYDPGTFEDFCNEFGYNTDSRKAEKTYKAVQDEYLNVSRLFTETELELMKEIQ